MSTLSLALALFLHTLRPARDLGNRLVIARRLRHAALFQDSRPVHQPLFLPLVSGFSSFDKGRGTSDLQRIRCEGCKAREPVLVRNHSIESDPLLSWDRIGSTQKSKVGHRLQGLEFAPGLLPGRDAVIFRAVPAHPALVRSADHGDALSDPIFWMPLFPHATVRP